MNCEKASLLIEELYDRELKGPMKKQVEEHITACSFCSVMFNDMCKLDGLLGKASVPSASPLFDQKLLHAFNAKHRREEKTDSRWSWIFTSSIRIPTPAFAALSILIAAAFITANIMWKNNVNQATITAEIQATAAPNVLPSAAPEIIERTKIVEVPIVKEQIVTRVVYVDRKNRGGKKNHLPVLDRNAPSKNFLQLPVREDNLALKGSDAQNQYITRVSLDGFQPTAEPKVRVIREEGANEK